MKKIIAGMALVGTILSTSAGAFADTHVAQQTTVQTEAQATTQTSTQADAATEVTTTAVDAAAETNAEVTVTAETELPEVKLTPDQFFYFLKIWVENLQLTVTRDAAEKAALLEAQAQTRLAEAKVMADAGKLDLAEQAMVEAKAKLEAAVAQIEVAAAANKDISELTAKIEADQAKFAAALLAVVEKAPESVKAEIELAAAELLLQLALVQDTAKPDEQLADEAEKVAAETELKAELSAMQPRMVLVLNAMAQASGKSLAEVHAMYQQNPGLGRIAKELGVKMGPVQHAAQAQWKTSKIVDVAALLKVEAETETEVEVEVEAEAEAKTETETKTKAKVKVKEETKVEVKTDKVEVKAGGKTGIGIGLGNDKEKSNNGKGNGNGR